jgi:hypothetical protein
MTPGGIVEHRHLLPDEIDLLVDGEEGFGVAPLMAHVERCPACRSELQAQQRLVAELERLPHHAPAPLFSSRVLSRVQVFEPWHVALVNTVQRLVPRSRPARVLAGVTAGSVALLVTLGTFWIYARLDAVVFLGMAALERIRFAGLQVIGGLASALLGSTGVPSTGPVGVSVTVGLLVAAIVVAALGIRQLATVSRRRRM